MTLTRAPARVSLLAWACATIALGVGAVKIVSTVLAPGPFRLLAFNSDDVHYYVLTALHAAAGDGSTFDGITPTNGYQPLWFLLLTAVFRVLGVDRAGAYTATIAVLVVLWVAALALLYRLGREVLGTVGTLAGLVGFLVHARWWTGCENALAVVLLLGVVLLVLTRPVLVGAPSTRAVAWLGVLLALLVLARLDTAVLVGVLALVSLWRWRERRGVLLVLLAGPAAVTLGAYALVDQLVFGVPVPVSGLAKQLGPLGQNWSVLRDFLLYGQLGPLPLLFGVSVVVAGGVAFALLGRALPSPLGEHAPVVRDVLAVLLLAQAGQLLYYAVMSSWELQSWYFSFGLVALVIALGVIGARLSAVRFVPHVVLGALALALLVVTAHEATALDPGPPDASPYAADIAAGQWADAALPPGTVLAMGDWAGTLAASTRHPVVQLEGLVTSPEYLRALQDGTARSWLADQGVTHYARLTHPGETVGCRVDEPYFGLGPRVAFDVCGRPLVYRGTVQGVIELLVWDVRR
ncbi:hypothetical protein ACQPX6_25230 [Actinomycetospora sp. CA-101289]|uniref:hypothetical protein n=1 Tax=Actinomycetospora sp. CA-101289 TaxID=3239893 RepID=UPI003D970F3B